MTDAALKQLCAQALRQVQSLTVQVRRVQARNGAGLVRWSLELPPTAGARFRAGIKTSFRRRRDVEVCPGIRS